MERGGRLDLGGIFWNANSHEQYTQWCMKRVAFIPGYSAISGSGLGTRIRSEYKDGGVLVLNCGHLAVLGRRIPACETPFGSHEVVASV